MTLPVPRALQILVRRDSAAFLAECIEFPVAFESEFLDEAVTGVEREIRKYLEDRDAWEPEGVVLFFSLYFGRFGGA